MTTIMSLVGIVTLFSLALLANLMSVVLAGLFVSLQAP
jgi:hypothetical protein